MIISVAGYIYRLQLWHNLLLSNLGKAFSTMPFWAHYIIKEKPKMNFNKIKKLATVSAVALALLSGANQAHAQATTAQIGASFATAAGLASAAGTTMDFGTWAVNIAGGDTPTIALTAVTAGAPPVPVPAGLVDPGTVVTNTVAPPSSGTVTVTSPFATTLQIQAVLTANFSDPDLSLGTLVYTDTVATNVAIPAAFNGTTLATVTAAATPETIAIGGTLTIGGGGGTPAVSTTFSDALIDVSFTF